MTWFLRNGRHTFATSLWCVCVSPSLSPTLHHFTREKVSWRSSNSPPSRLGVPEKKEKHNSSKTLAKHHRLDPHLLSTHSTSLYRQRQETIFLLTFFACRRRRRRGGWLVCAHRLCKGPGRLPGEWPTFLWMVMFRLFHICHLAHQLYAPIL